MSIYTGRLVLSVRLGISVLRAIQRASPRAHSDFVKLILKTFCHHRFLWRWPTHRATLGYLSHISIETQFVLIILSKNLILLCLINVRPHHLKLPDNLHRFPNIETKRFKALINEYLTLLRDLILCDCIKVRKTLMQKSSNILNLL
jgi:hypothetical protein